MFRRLLNTFTSTPPPPSQKDHDDLVRRIKANKPVQVLYESLPITIPPNFLTVDPPDAKPITINRIDFANSALPEYTDHHAYILDYVLSPSECAELLALAESSVADASKAEDGSPWRRAMVAVGVGYEVFTPNYRNSDRLIWDQQEVIDRIWERCLRADGLRERMAEVKREPVITRGCKLERRREEGSWFRFVRVNERMRFLKYSGGGFFQAHRDASFGEERDGKMQESLFTLHLYLNDSKAAAGESAELVGGATPFLSNDYKRRIDVDPKAGRVLIFQQRGLLHSGDDVKEGMKYTMRTDIMYEVVDEK
ncbi:hypothetical protein QBC34DRAFT_395124 [Podospora aff. communis PSN243]|uniref:Prolyl 4-hydroxylase alpha subunit domain-containing protein n=1 Tax=Podospora aff. communis PSN243 TaxID=3040156 RepID=A0AAV9GZB4_9PEZI|nr:hypothetical protein QBC34DRAFT_395124 [Podospora aff. communis PSN243]